MHPQLPEDVRAMVLDRANRQIQAPRDLRVRVSEREQPRHLDLAGRQPACREDVVDASFSDGDSGVRETGPSLGPERGVFGRAFRYPHLNRGAARPAFDPAPAPGDLGPLEHGGEPGMTILGSLGSGDVEPDTVVLDDDVEPTG